MADYKKSSSNGSPSHKIIVISWLINVVNAHQTTQLFWATVILGVLEEYFNYFDSTMQMKRCKILLAACFSLSYHCRVEQRNNILHCVTTGKIPLPQAKACVPFVQIKFSMVAVKYCTAFPEYLPRYGGEEITVPVNQQTAVMSLHM